MITTAKERTIFVDLVKALEQNIKDCGRCDHSVNICFCDLHRLRDECTEVLDSNKIVLSS